MLFSSLLFVFAWQWLLSDFNPLFKNEVYLNLKREIVWNTRINSKKIFKVIKVYNKLYPLKNFVGKCFDNSSESASWSFVNNYLYNIGDSVCAKRFNMMLFLFKLERNFNQEDILTTLLLKYDFCNGNKGVTQSSKFYFKKDITQLSQKKLIALVIMSRNPSFYNPIKHKDKFAKQICKVLQRIN